MANKPTKPELYARIKAKVKARVKKWPSAYQVVKLLESIKQQVEDTPKPNES